MHIGKRIFTVPQMYVGAAALTAVTCLLAFVAWGQGNQWHFNGLSTYQVFPIFGLLAFSIMWSQYMIAAAKKYLGYTDEIDTYFTVTGFLVLASILFHPGLLIAQRFRDGYGLPPGSYVSYVAPTEKWIVLLGSVCLLIFLSYELKWWFKEHSWWRYIVLLNDVAIVAIFYHGLRLGQTLQSGWFQIIWYCYGILLVSVLAYKYYETYAARVRA
jgi:hypothetical protein